MSPNNAPNHIAIPPPISTSTAHAPANAAEVANLDGRNDTSQPRTNNGDSQADIEMASSQGDETIEDSEGDDQHVDADGEVRRRRPTIDPDFKPRGILKNARSYSSTSGHHPAISSYSRSSSRADAREGEDHEVFEESGPSTQTESGRFAGLTKEARERLTWDEQNLNLNEINRDSRMKIDEPKTPFVKHDPALEDLGEVPDFELSSPSTPGGMERRTSQTGASPRSRRKSEQELVAQNTEINAGRSRVPGYPFDAVSPFASDSNPLSPTPASPITNTPPSRDRHRSSSNPSSSGPNSRSASFSLPGETSGRKIEGMGINGNGGGDINVDGESDKEGEEPKAAEFKKAVKEHYSNEADAMKLAQALMAQEQLDDDDESEE